MQILKNYFKFLSFKTNMFEKLNLVRNLGEKEVDKRGYSRTVKLMKIFASKYFNTKRASNS
jgi:hypothetical protein